MGGWFITAGAAFIIAALVATVMNLGGVIAMYIMIALVIYLLIRSHINYNKKKSTEKVDEKMNVVLKSDDTEEVWSNLQGHAAETPIRPPSSSELRMRIKSDLSSTFCSSCSSKDASQASSSAK